MSSRTEPAFQKREAARWQDRHFTHLGGNQHHISRRQAVHIVLPFDLAASVGLEHDENAALARSTDREALIRRPAVQREVAAIDELLDLSPRKIKAALTTAAGNAIIAGRTYISALDIEDEPERKRKQIGFVS